MCDSMTSSAHICDARLIRQPNHDPVCWRNQRERLVGDPLHQPLWIDRLKYCCGEVGIGHGVCLLFGELNLSSATASYGG